MSPGPAARKPGAWPDIHARRDRLVLILILALPLLLIATAGLHAWRQEKAEAVAQIGGTARAAAEFTRRVFDGLVLRIERANDILAGLRDEEIVAREAEFHVLLRQAAEAGPRESDQRAPYMFVYTADSVPIASGNVFPVPTRSFADREFNIALRGAGAPDTHVSPVYRGVVTREPYFALTHRRERTGNGRAPGAYDGVINASVYVDEFAHSLRRINHATDIIILARADGTVLVRSDQAVAPGERLAPDSIAAQALRDGAPQAGLEGRDGELIALRQVEGYPVYALVMQPRAALVSAWQHAVVGQLAIGLPLTLAVAGLAWLVRRGQRRLAEANAALEARVAERTAALSASEQRLVLAQEAGAVGTWEFEPRSGRIHWSRQAAALFGRDPDASAPPLPTILGMMHPDDRAQARSALRRALAGGAAEAEFRIRLPSGAERWLFSRGRNVAADRRAPRFIGTTMDITERKAAEIRQSLLMRELDHRAKNMLAMVQSMMRLTRADTVDDFVDAVQGRIEALARVHTMLANQRWDGAWLGALLAGEFEHELGDEPPTVTLQGPPARLLPEVAQSLGMALHELATNAERHGALSAPGGRLAIAWHVEDDGQTRTLRLEWQESGGPALTGEPRCGFGATLIEGTIAGQLGGTLDRHWDRDGFRCSLSVPLESRRVQDARATRKPAMAAVRPRRPVVASRAR